MTSRAFTFALAALPVALLAACSRTPSPLAPGFAGSVGAPGHGVLAGGVELPPEGTGYRWLRREGHHHGLPRLVAAVQGSAAEVLRERPGGAPLLVGDLSAPHGGGIPQHRSHRTGRDVDLLFFTTTPEGVPVPSPGFVRFGPDGLAFVPPEQGGPRFVRFDVEREWLLVKSLVSSPDANVQWLFISRPLEAMLVEYALARGEDAALVWRAAAVLQQPGDSLPHDDHLHLRTACTPDEALAGCEGGGPYWPWLPALPGAPREPEDDLVAALLAPFGGEATLATK